MTTKILHIITGPPGSGKTTLAKTAKFKDLQVYDTDLGNKNEWLLHKGSSCILMTSAPSSEIKSYWITQAEFHNFTPILYTMWIPRMVSLQRMTQRSGLSKTERNDLNKSVERWYKLYSRHPKEIRCD